MLGLPRNHSRGMDPSDKQLSTSLDQFLPPELLSHIFSLTLPEEFESKKASIHSGPLVLGMVFKHWREILHATPEL